MAKRRKKRTSIRTAAGTVQKQFLVRVRALRDDPLCVLPESIGEEPKPLQRIRSRLQRIKAGKIGWLDRRDKGVVGAVAHAVLLADMETVPRIADVKVAGKRRFFLQRGHVDRMISMAVQNHDEPIALLAAYRPLAKDNGLHFFAGPRLWCNAQAVPPQEWVEAWLGFGPTDDGCPHAERPRIRLRFHEGPAYAVCARCAKEQLHQRLAARYAGPRQRQPIEVSFVAPDGSERSLDREVIASYRAGVLDEAAVIAHGVEAWQDRSGARWAIGSRDFGDDQAAFLDALDLEDWERAALQAATRDGHVGMEDSVEAILSAHGDRIVDAWSAVTDAPPGTPPRDVRAWLRRGHEEEQRRRRLDALPKPDATGPIGRFLDDAARIHVADGREAALAAARKGAAGIPPFQAAAAVLALGGSLGPGADEATRDAAKQWKSSLEAVFGSVGDAYLEHLRIHLKESGTGESV